MAVPPIMIGACPLHKVHSGQGMMIFIHAPIHELLHTITGIAHFGDYGAL
jgi:hypothetical protein